MEVTARFAYPRDWSADGKYIVYQHYEGAAGLSILPTFGEKKPIPFLQGGGEGRFSPNGRWLAYDSSLDFHSAGKDLTLQCAASRHTPTPVG
jgi:hypothetical protein